MKNLESYEGVSQSDLSILAKKYGFAGKIPAEGTSAYSRLEGLCKNYDNLSKARLGAIRTSDQKYNEALSTGSDERQRELHNELCLMILGTTWPKTESLNRQKISNFARDVNEILGGKYQGED